MSSRTVGGTEGTAEMEDDILDTPDLMLVTAWSRMSRLETAENIATWRPCHRLLASPGAASWLASDIIKEEESLFARSSSASCLLSAKTLTFSSSLIKRI